MSKKYNNYQKNFKPTDHVEEETEVEELKKVKVNCNLLNVREQPNKDSKVLLVVKLEDEMTLLDTINNEWCKVETNDTIGYCMTEFIDFI